MLSNVIPLQQPYGWGHISILILPVRKLKPRASWLILAETQASQAILGHFIPLTLPLRSQNPCCEKLLSHVIPLTFRWPNPSQQEMIASTWNATPNKKCSLLSRKIWVSIQQTFIEYILQSDSVLCTLTYLFCHNKWFYWYAWKWKKTPIKKKIECTLWLRRTHLEFSLHRPSLGRDVMTVLKASSYECPNISSTHLVCSLIKLSVFQYLLWLRIMTIYPFGW